MTFSLREVKRINRRESVQKSVRFSKGRKKKQSNFFFPEKKTRDCGRIKLRSIHSSVIKHNFDLDFC